MCSLPQPKCKKIEKAKKSFAFQKHRRASGLQKILVARFELGFLFACFLGQKMPFPLGFLEEFGCRGLTAGKFFACFQICFNFCNIFCPGVSKFFSNVKPRIGFIPKVTGNPKKNNPTIFYITPFSFFPAVRMISLRYSAMPLFQLPFKTVGMKYIYLLEPLVWARLIEKKVKNQNG